MTKAQVAKKINKELHEFNINYYGAIPLEDIFDILDKYEYVPIQEDGTPWEGFLLGEDSYAIFECVHLGDLKPLFLYLSWYKMPSGRYEIVTYIS